MKTSEYIYGVPITELPTMTEGLTARIDCAKKLLNELLEVPLIERDFARITAVIDSISHNNKLLYGAI